MNNNVFLAVLLSFGILVGFQFFYVNPQQEALQNRRAIQHVAPESITAPSAASSPVQAALPRDQVLRQNPRVTIQSPVLAGSINLRGARFDDLVLSSYRETVDKNSPPITLLSPSGSSAPYRPYYVSFSWLADFNVLDVPNDETIWKADRNALTPDHSVQLSWRNKQGLLFLRTVAVDKEYMFTITDRVVNESGRDVMLYPFGLAARQGIPPHETSSVVHEGPLAVLDGTLDEVDYDDVMDDGKISKKSKGGWIGITDKYWLVAMVPPQNDLMVGEFAYNRAGAVLPKDGFFQADFRGNPVSISTGGSVERVTHLFAGPKRVDLLDQYADQYDIPRFDRAIDFGWFYFLTRPFLSLLSLMESATGSMAWAILLFTILLRIAVLPLSQKSYRSMARMKEIQPEMKRIQERFADDRMRQSQEMMELYKREKVNPLSGCMPTLIQIPIFFALYKVLYVNIEMRQAPFFGWIHDMAIPDPTSLFNGFGLLPYDVPSFLQIGAWPVLMGLSMFLQQKLSPQPPDKSQARIFMILPVVFTFMLAHMPAGLVIYWTWSNLLGILQQWYIMRGVRNKTA
ncbi:MAG: membrane protein insertase YidC [Alphaproteobacteria bacterium]|nr:membrane protein insertase YidC [Alphaproteobacteria bacterium]